LSRKQIAVPLPSKTTNLSSQKVSIISNYIIRPVPLQKGDTVGIVALACKVNLETIKLGIEILENWGLHVVLGKSVFSDYHQFAGDDKIRLIFKK
jgi:hypothetical protein